MALSNEDTFVSEIRRFVREHCPEQDSELGIGDDAAVLPWAPNTKLVLSVDDHCEGVHFRHRWCPPESIGRRAAGSALSDLAAMGAKARGAMLSLHCPKSLSSDLLRGVIKGFTESLGQHSAVLYGGNLTQSSTLNLSVSVFGELTRAQAWTRSAARSGDDLWVSGILGRSNLAFRSLDKQSRDNANNHNEAFLEVQKRYLNPTPRFDLVDSVIPDTAACMDISDGLARDAGRMARASGQCFVIHREAIVSDSVRSLAERLSLDPHDVVYQSGEEYELLFAIPAEHRKSLESLGLIRIGEVQALPQGGHYLVDDLGRNIEESLGFDHFQKS
ncbi:MAG: thiamine-phosphate kinase [Planctomycetota bacterium]|nr:thiamine-phosphate kinase [Planctomycetota bacterium]